MPKLKLDVRSRRFYGLALLACMALAIGAGGVFAACNEGSSAEPETSATATAKPKVKRVVRASPSAQPSETPTPPPEPPPAEAHSHHVEGPPPRGGGH